MKLHHSPEHIAKDGIDFSDNRKYGKFAHVDNAIEIYDEWHNNIGTVVYDPALKHELALSILDEDDAPSNDWHYLSPEEAVQCCSTEELEYLAWTYLKAIQIKQEDELARAREQKKLHDLGQKLREKYLSLSRGSHDSAVWSELARIAEKELSA